MVIIGVDPHKRTHTASAVEPAHEPAAGDVADRRVACWLPAAAEVGRRVRASARWAVENARGSGPASGAVAGRRESEVVDDVPSTATARVRELSRGGRRKNDVIDAAAAASVAALHGDANPVVAEDLTTVLALLDERRNNLITQRTRLVNQLHALLRDLMPGGAPTDLTATAASRLLDRRATGGSGRGRPQAAGPRPGRRDPRRRPTAQDAHRPDRRTRSRDTAAA